MTLDEAIIFVETLKTVIKDIPKYNGSGIDKALDMAIRSLEAWDKVKDEIINIRDIEAKCHDPFDDYSDGRYDVACESLRIINEHLKEV